ncbi:MAG: hypothetical protein Q8Q62_06390 [Mesorhizobium sp.]|nr:hypothetical protein [Mesorhizobium sp.]
MSAQDSDDMRVADYVLGLMDAKETAFFERDMRRDPALALAVSAWQQRIAKLEEPVGPMTPQAEMQRRIRDELIAAQGRSAPAMPRPAGAQRAWWRDLVLPAIGFALIVGLIWSFMRS